mmetsp:Transcript_17380/g.41877  ORF Transcript_17380/g.41877 Transcript_17380/m.41877 type:complete len:292 (-) Transcript_17380:107-982(-)
MATCCKYKTAKRLMIVVNFVMLLLSLIFMAVGAISLSYGMSFSNTLDQYCEEACNPGTSTEAVGCDCTSSPPTTTLPSLVFQSPASGLIVVGVLSFICSIIGCAGAVRENRKLVWAYMAFILFILVLTIGFFGAAATVSTGAAPSVSGPLMGALEINYRQFDWEPFHLFFPEACFAGTTPPNANDVSYSFPLCGFNGECVKTGYVDSREPTCCASDGSCDTAIKSCTYGRACVLSLLYYAAAPVATAAFFAIVIQVAGLVLACVVRPVIGRLEFPDRNRRYKLDESEMEEV